MMFFLFIGLILCVAICIGCGWLIYRLQVKLHQQEEKARQMQQDLHGLILCMRGISERFARQQKLIRSVTIRQNDIQAKSSNDSIYEKAALLMDKGATVEELITTCGLSKGEAELMARINAMQLEESASQTALR